MKLPKDLTAYAVDGLLPRLLTPADVPAMLALQAEVLEALPDKRWYYPSDDEEFRQVFPPAKASPILTATRCWALPS